MSKILLFIFAALSSIILISCTACIVKYDIVGTVIALPAVIVAKAFFVAHIPSYVVFATTIAISPKLIIAFFVCGAVYELAIYCFYNQAQTGKFFKEVLDQASGRKQKTITNLLSDNAIITIKTTLLWLFGVVVVVSCFYLCLSCSSVILMLPAHVAAIILFVTKLPMYVIYAAMAVLSIKLLVVFFACTTIYATVACCFKNRKKISKFFKEVLKQIRGDEQTSTDSFINANTMFISKVIFFVLLWVTASIFCFYMCWTYVDLIIMLPTIIVSKILFIANLPQHVIYAVAAPALLKLVSAFFLCTTVYAVIILCYNNRMLVLKFIKAALNQANGGERIKAKDFLSEETIFVIQAMFIGLFIIAVILFCLYIGVNYVAWHHVWWVIVNTFYLHMLHVAIAFVILARVVNAIATWHAIIITIYSLVSTAALKVVTPWYRRIFYVCVIIMVCTLVLFVTWLVFQFRANFWRCLMAAVKKNDLHGMIIILTILTIMHLIEVAVIYLLLYKTGVYPSKNTVSRLLRRVYKWILAALAIFLIFFVIAYIFIALL